MTEILRGLEELRAWRRSAGDDVGFVPTMGALHQGHLSLMALSKAQCRRTIASIFVNPLQFGPGEDYLHYPRPFERDRALLVEAGVDAVFLPEAELLYRPDSSTFVVEEQVSLPLCGAFRPGHFRGVATVVLKLLNLAQPDVAFFGQKDAQQCAVIERMVRDLNVPVEIVRGPIVREADGLAMSSRNVYLSPTERLAAPRLHQGLAQIAAGYAAGERNPAALLGTGHALLTSESAIKLQYLEIRDAEALDLVARLGVRPALVAIAAFVGKTRLIDNVVLVPPASGA